MKYALLLVMGLIAAPAMADESPNFGSGSSYRGGGDLINSARQYIGRNPTGKRSLWCADFANYILKKNGYSSTESRAARSFARYGTRTHLKENAIAVLTRKGGGHVVVVTEVLGGGLFKGVGGNSCKRNGRSIVCEGTYSTSRLIAVVEPRG